MKYGSMICSLKGEKSQFHCKVSKTDSNRYVRLFACYKQLISLADTYFYTVFAQIFNVEAKLIQFREIF